MNNVIELYYKIHINLAELLVYLNHLVLCVLFDNVERQGHRPGQDAGLHEHHGSPDRRPRGEEPEPGEPSSPPALQWRLWLQGETRLLVDGAARGSGAPGAERRVGEGARTRDRRRRLDTVVLVSGGGPPRGDRAGGGAGGARRRGRAGGARAGRDQGDGVLHGGGRRRQAAGRWHCSLHLYAASNGMKRTVIDHKNNVHTCMHLRASRSKS